MAPKVRITKDDIINSALELVRESGAESINARSIAAYLSCSTQPIFSNFSSMDELFKTVILAAYNLYLNFIHREVETEKYPKYKAYGMAYVRFAKEERELFKLLFMRDRTGEDTSPSPDFNESVEIISNSCGVSRSTAELMHLELWTFVHGIGTMLATSFLSLDMELISDMLSDVYFGIRARHMMVEGEK